MTKLVAWEATVAGARVRVAVREGPDGLPAEVCATLPDAPMGAAIPTMMEAISRGINVGLARGANLREYTHALKGNRFVPSGDVVGDPHITTAVSVVDYMARSLEARYALPPVDGPQGAR